MSRHGLSKHRMRLAKTTFELVIQQYYIHEILVLAADGGIVGVFSALFLVFHVFFVFRMWRADCIQCRPFEGKLLLSSPVLGTNHSTFRQFVPKTGRQFCPKRVTTKYNRSLYLGTWY